MKRFAKDKLIEIDVISKRYGVRPSSYLEADTNKFLFDLLVASVGIEGEAKAQRKAQSGKRRS